MGRDVVVGVKKYRINKDNGDDSDGNKDVNEGGEDVVGAIRVNNAAVIESQIRKLGELRANRDENEVREAPDRLNRSAVLSKDDNNNDNIITNSNNGKNSNGNVGGRRREEISTSRGDHPQNLLRMSV